MRTALNFALALVLVGMVTAAAAQSPSASSTDLNPETATQAQTPAATPEVAPSISPAVAILRDFHDSDVKFQLSNLMDTLRDRRHEGWVLSAYPDPKTAKALIGAGFSLDLPVREHPQNDPMNPHPFLEPSSADLWQAAGLEPARLDGILKVFY